MKNGWAKKRCWMTWKERAQRRWRQILTETPVPSSSLTGVWWGRLGRFPAAVMEAGMQAPHAWLPDCSLASFSGDLQHFEGDIYKKQQLRLRDKLGRRKRCCSSQRHITPAAPLPLSCCQCANLGKKDMVWHTSLASCWTLDETVASCNEKSFRTFFLLSRLQPPRSHRSGSRCASSDLLCRASKREDSVCGEVCQQTAGCFLFLQTLMQTLARFSALVVLSLLAQSSFG